MVNCDKYFLSLACVRQQCDVNHLVKITFTTVIISKLATVIEGVPKAPFPNLLHLGVEEVATPFPGR